MKPLLLIDADYLVYSAGFAVEKVAYAVSCKTPKGRNYEDVVDTLVAAEAWREGRAWPLGTVHRKPVRMVDAEPFSHARLIVNNILKKIHSRASAHFGTDYATMTFLTGGSNYRNDIATIRKYKGNRDALHKPVHYAALRDHLMATGAVRVEGYEADDAVSMAAHACNYENVVIAAVDKDLWTVPGWHYNFKNDFWEWVKPWQARYNFYTQLLIGDPVDNILGCYKCGVRTAKKVLAGHMSDRELYEACLEEYRGSVLLKGCPYSDPYAALLENARLLHMLRFQGDVWHPPSLPADHSLNEISSATLQSGESATNTKQTPSISSSPSQTSEASSSVLPAEQKSAAPLATPQTSNSRARSTTSKRKAGFSRKSSADLQRSTSST